MKSGLYWAKLKLDNSWYLVEIEEYDDRIWENIPEAQGPYCVPLSWQKTRKAYHVYFMGSEQPDDPNNYSEFVLANLKDPDGNPYYNTGDNYQGN